MAVESGANFISDLNILWPDGAVDPKSDGDNHLRLIKRTLKSSFPGVAGAVTATHTNLNALSGLSSGVTATQLNFLTGLTGNVQTALNGKANLTGSAFTGDVSITAASGVTSAFRVYNGTFGGGSLWTDTSGNVTLGQISSVGAYEKPWLTATKNGDVILWGNGTARLATNIFGVSIAGAVSTTLDANIGGEVNAVGDVNTQGNVVALGNVVAYAGAVADSKGTIKGYRQGATIALSGTSPAFTGIPSDAVMIKIVFTDAAFTSSSENPALLVNTAVDFSGSTQGLASDGSSWRHSWDLFGKMNLTAGSGGGETMAGVINLTLLPGVSWVVDGVTSRFKTLAGGTSHLSGSVVVSSPPSTITLGSVSGTGVYNNGHATIYYYR